MYAIVCVPFDTPTSLYLHHHRASSDGWKSLNYCDDCSKDFERIIKPFVDNCTSNPSCQCPVCLRKPPSLRNLVSHTVFHFTFNLSPFTLSNRTSYHQYLYAIESATVSEEELVPQTFFPYSELKCIFVRDRRCAPNKRFHNDCVLPSERYGATTYSMLCESPEEAIALLPADQEHWWCDFCTRPLFTTRSCL